MLKLIKPLSAVLLFVSLNAAASIVYVTDARYTILYTTTEHLQTPSVPFGAFNSNMWGFEAGTYQNSSMNSTSITGAGSTYAGLDASHYGASGRSVFDVTFTVDQLTNFSLSGALTTTYAEVVSATLLANGTAIFSAEPYDGAFSLDGQFSTDTQYQLIMVSATTFSDYLNEGWDFNLTTTPVPVPGALWLLGSGILGLFGIMRKRIAA